MTNPTPKECHQLAEAFEDDFTYVEKKHDLHFLLRDECGWETSISLVGEEWFAEDNNGEDWLNISDTLGQAALMMKCMEVVAAMGRAILRENFDRSWSVTIQQNESGFSKKVVGHGDTPWAALLATKTEVAPDGE